MPSADFASESSSLNMTLAHQTSNEFLYQEKVASWENHPPILWGINNQNRQLYISVTEPGQTAADISLYLFGNSLQEHIFAGYGAANRSNARIAAGTVMTDFGEGQLSHQAENRLQRDLRDGTILRSDGIPTSETGEIMLYRFQANSQSYQLTEAQYRQSLEGTRIWLLRRVEMIRLNAGDSLWSRDMHEDESFAPVRAVSDWFGGVELPGGMQWRIVRIQADAIKNSLDFNASEANLQAMAGIIRAAMQELAQASQALDRADHSWKVYIQGTIGGAEHAIHYLELPRNTSFGIVAGLAGAVAAPAAFTALTSGAVAFGTGSATATSLAAAGLAGGTACGGLELIAPGMNANQTASQQFSHGFYSGAGQGVLGGAGAFLAPAASGMVANQIVQRGGQQFLGTSLGRYTVNATSSALIGAPSGLVGTGYDNLPAYLSGRMSGQEYRNQALYGMAFGAGFGLAAPLIPVRGFHRQSGIPLHFGNPVTSPRWLLTGSYAPIQRNWSPIPEFNELAVRPRLPEGYTWTRLGNQWEPIRNYGRFDAPIWLRQYVYNRTGQVGFVLMEGNRMLESIAFTRSSSYRGPRGDLNQIAGNFQLDPNSPAMHSRLANTPDRLSAIRGHGIDHADTPECLSYSTGDYTLSPEYLGSNLNVESSRLATNDPANIAPEVPEFNASGSRASTGWGNGPRRTLVNRIRSQGGGYREIKIYDPNPPRTASGHAFPERVFFIETEMQQGEPSEPGKFHTIWVLYHAR